MFWNIETVEADRTALISADTHHTTTYQALTLRRDAYAAQMMEGAMVNMAFWPLLVFC